MYVCEPKTTNVAVNPDGHLSGIPKLTKFRKKGFVWWVIDTVSRLASHQKRRTFASSEGTVHLVAAADPRVLEELALELFGCNANGSQIELIIIPSLVYDECSPIPEV